MRLIIVYCALIALIVIAFGTGHWVFGIIFTLLFAGLIGTVMYFGSGFQSFKNLFK